MKKSAMLFISFCLFASHSAMAQSAKEAEPIRVKVVTVREETKPLIDQVVGTVTVRNKPVVSAQIAGTLLKTHAETGKRVKRGDLLAELTSPEADARLSAAKSALELASREYARSQELVKNGTISKEAHDQAVASMQSAKATAKEAETAVSYKRVVAPTDGIIRTRLVNGGEVTSPGKPLFEMEGEGAMRFEANVAETMSGSLRPGTQVPVRIDAVDTQVTGTLSEITPSADPVSRTFLVRFDLPETTGILAGQFGRALLPAGETTVLRIPPNALLRQGQMDTVYTIDGNVARLRLVRSGKATADGVELLAGLSSGEVVATTEVSRLRDGSRVEVQK